MYNYETTARMNETGLVIQATLIDEDGPVDLTGWVGVIMNVKTEGGQSIISAEPCTITNVAGGQISVTIDITTAAYPNMKRGLHRIIFTATDSAGDLHTFPKSHRRPWGILRVLEA